MDRLREHLSNARFKHADKETARIVYAAAGVDEQGPLYASHLPSLPPKTLVEVDALWRAHSHGRFGFAPQAAAWERSGGDYKLFATFLGWRRRNAYISYAAANFDLSAPDGHLPIGGPDGLLFEDETGAGLLEELGEMFKTAYRDIGERGGVRRAAVTVFKAKVLDDREPDDEYHATASDW